jgi:outer membrane immunogenic protein
VLYGKGRIGAASLGSRDGRGAPIAKVGTTMKKILLASVASIALGMGVASAADLPVKAPPLPPPPVFSWTGCYIGGNIGGAWAHSEWQDSRFGLNWGRTSDTRFIGGIQGGCNYQFQNPGFVIGVEGDFDWLANNGNTRTVVVPAGFPRAGDVIALSSNDTRIATLAARFGYAFDRALLYGKFGGGWVGNNGFTVVDQTTGAAFVGNNSNTASGWMAGAGIEYAFTNNWSAKVEWDYIRLSDRTFVLPGVIIPALAGDTITSDHNVQMVKFGINYRFGWGGPVGY